MENGDRDLSLISRAAKALAEARTVPEIKRVADLAEMARQWAKRVNAGHETVMLAAEIKLRASRKLGGVLPGVINNGTQSHATTLSELDISKDVSHRSQRIAAVPDDAFESYIADSIDADKEPTMAGALKLAAQQPKPKQPDYVMPEGAREVSDLAEVEGEKFGCIYADPPWKYGNQSTRAATDNHYATMSIDELCDMPVMELAADDAHLHLWTTNAFVRESFQVIEAWGFEYRSMFVWVKPQMGIGNYWRVSHELLMTAVRGNAKRFNDHSLMSWAELPRGKHSSKPDAVRGMVERASPGPFLELFGRLPVAGWTVFGNQIERRLFG